MEKKHTWRKSTKLLLFVAITIILVTTCYFILHAVIKQKIDEALKQISPEIQLHYSSLDVGLFSKSLIINDLSLTYLPKNSKPHQHYVSFSRVALTRIDFFKLISSKKLAAGELMLENGSVNLDPYLLDKNDPPPELNAPFNSISIDNLELKDIKGSVHAGKREDLSFAGALTLEKIKIDDLKKPFDETNLHIESIGCRASELKFDVPDAYRTVQIKNLVINSRQASLHVDSLKIIPKLDKFELGRKMGYQVDYIEGRSSGIDIEKLDLKQLMNKKLIAEKITVNQNNFYAFRDRRLLLKQEPKLPAEDLKNIPISIRVQSVAINGTHFTYEELPKNGDKTGTLRILRMHMLISPFINHPTKNDPAYITVKTEGSLMGSGTVQANMQLPLKPGNDYIVEGAFKDLDLTTLNSPAENLGKLHIESGMLNSLAFRFNMTNEKSTGQIIGEYHNLVIDKLRENSTEKKVDKFKSFALKHFIIPKNKDKTLAESKRTGKVSYKRDPSRYFSYYLLHSLLMGVKSSFSLGFLLPG